MNASELSLAEIAFRLTEGTDPEERLEEAVLWKCMADHYGNRIKPVTGSVPFPIPTFGRGLSARSFENMGTNPVIDRLDYWDDPSFLSACNRQFTVVEYEALKATIKKVHQSGRDALVKSCRSKHFLRTFTRDCDFHDVLGYDAYDFMDGGPRLMVQEYRPMEFEFRFFIIDRQIVTHSPKMQSLTPLDFPTIGTTGFRHHDDPNDHRDCSALIHRYSNLARSIAASMKTPDAAIDLAHTPDDDEICVVEFNPMQLGQLGLFACDVKKLAKHSEILLNRWQRPEPVIIEEEDFDDDLRM